MQDRFGSENRGPWKLNTKLGTTCHSALFHILQTPATLFGKSHHSALSHILQTSTHFSVTATLFLLKEEDDGTYTAALRNGTWKFMWGSPGDNNDWYATDGSVTEATDDDGTGEA